MKGIEFVCGVVSKVCGGLVGGERWRWKGVVRLLYGVRWIASEAAWNSGVSGFSFESGEWEKSSLLLSMGKAIYLVSDPIIWGRVA